jgi:Tfp pilus assembly protein PilF
MRARSWSSCLILALFSPALSSLSSCASWHGGEPHLRLAETSKTATSFETAAALLDQGKTAEAVSAFRTLLREGGPSIKVLNGLAVAHGELGRPDLAADLFAKALAIAPDDPATHNNIGYAALRRGEIGLARRYLEKAGRLGGSDAEIEANLAAVAWLEARRAGPRLKADRPSGLPGTSRLAVNRQTTSIVRLSGLEAGSEGPSSPHRPVGRPATSIASGLVDFTRLTDPWQRSSNATESNF